MDRMVNKHGEDKDIDYIIRLKKIIDDFPGAGQKCLFGYCWWFWLPRIRISKYNCDFQWLCFMASFWSDK